MKLNRLCELAEKAGFDTDLPAFKDGSAIALKLAKLAHADGQEAMRERAANEIEDSDIDTLDPLEAAQAIRNLEVE